MHLAASLKKSPRVILPCLLIEIRRQQPTGLIGQQWIDTDRAFTEQVMAGDFVGEWEILATALILQLEFAAGILLPFSNAGGRKRMNDRVFILGVLSEPEALRQDLGSLETIGMNLAKDCREETDTTWSHHLLQHNANELARLRQSLGEILFPSI